MSCSPSPWPTTAWARGPARTRRRRPAVLVVGCGVVGCRALCGLIPAGTGRRCGRLSARLWRTQVDAVVYPNRLKTLRGCADSYATAAAAPTTCGATTGRPARLNRLRARGRTRCTRDSGADGHHRLRAATLANVFGAGCCDRRRRGSDTKARVPIGSCAPGCEATAPVRRALRPPRSTTSRRQVGANGVDPRV
jgi:hypothetical protein